MEITARKDRTGKNVSILLIDDSETMLRHVSGLLRQEGYEVFTASDLVTALDAQRRHNPRVVLADFVLEGGSTGLQVLSAIFSLFPSDEGKPRAAILTLGKLSDADHRTASAMGVPVIQKPTHGKEHDFLQNIEFWLHSAGVI